MKLLENTIFDSVSSYIICNAIDFLLDVKLESYSCKMITSDKKEWKRGIKCPENGNDLQPLSPPEDMFMPLSSSPNFTLNFNHHNSGRLRHISEPSSLGSDNDADENNTILVGAVSRRTLFDIVALLNLSYSDYDFSQTKSACFTTISYAACVQNVDAKFSSTVANYTRVRDEIWKVINDEIKIADCVIYSYIPSYSGDPFTEDGVIWSFNYLFYNKNLKRFLFFACRALHLHSENLDLSSEQLYGANDDEEEIIEE